MRSEHRVRFVGWLLASVLLNGGCVVGGGAGWVLGSLNVEECRDGEPLVNEGDFDLNADFFVGDPLLDSSDAKAIKRSSVTIRIQNTSNHIEQSDGLMLHLHDVAAAAAGFARGEAVGVGECFDLAGCPSGGLVLRAQLKLYNRCPGNRSGLTASNREVSISTDPDEPQCFLPQPETNVSLCPALDETQKQRLSELCDGDFNDRTAASELKQILARDNIFDETRAAGSACIYFCELGTAQRGQSAEELAEFELDYGDEIAALFAFNVVDARAFQLNDCATTRGQIYGQFRFELMRSRAAQAFP